MTYNDYNQPLSIMYVQKLGLQENYRNYLFTVQYVNVTE